LGETIQARDDAEESCRRGIALGDAIGAKPEVAHCHAGLARLYRRTGRQQQAEEHFTTATTMYREMGMTYWLEKAQAEIDG
jgi:Tfp pilus assembly protein PilF